MSSSNKTSPSSDPDSSSPPEASESSPATADSSFSNLTELSHHLLSTESNSTAPLGDEEAGDGDSSSSSPSPTSDPEPSSPPPSEVNNGNASDNKSSPPPRAPPPPPSSPPPSPPNPPPDSSPPPESSESGNAAPPPSPSPSKTKPPETKGSPPSPEYQNAPVPKNNTIASGPETNEKLPPSEPTNNAPPQSENPVVIPSPGAKPETSKQVPRPPTGTTTPTSESNVLPPPTTTSTRNPNASPPSPNSRQVKPSSEDANTPPSGSNRDSGVVIGAAVAGVFVLALIAMFFAFSRKKKRQEDLYAGPYLPPKNFCVKSDGNYYPNQQMGSSGPAEGFYTPVPHTPIGNSFESQRGNGYSGGGMESGVINSAKSFFTYEELMEITSGFSRQNILGEGGFGCVFKGWLPEGKPVAVKQLKAGSGQGEREFKAEVEIISRVHHRHLVSLVGYCISDNHRLLIYEYVPNKTLEHHLQSSSAVPVLEWSKRLKIALGAAKGLAYLHEDCHPKIIHRDIKSANILLDDAFEAQVADFGLAKLTNDTSTHVSTRVMGTFGYMAPEYASSGKLTDRSDVFSFGVVLLELITGRKPVDPTQPLGDESLVEWARPHLLRALETGDFGELIDPRLEKHYVESEVFRMIEAAAACVRHSAPKRPRMVQVVRALDTESDMSDLSNGVKYGQSTIYDSGQYNQDISKFRRMALGDSSEYDVYSSEYSSREMSASRESWRSQDNSSCESETRAFNGRSAIPQSHYGPRRL